MDPPLVLVSWYDAWFDFESNGSPRKTYVVQTVGFLIRDEDGVLSLAQEMLPDRDGYRAVTHIPQAVVSDITYLRPAAEEGGVRVDRSRSAGPGATGP